MVSGEGLLFAIAFALGFVFGSNTIEGLTWIGHEAKQGGAAVVRVLKKIPHPHHTPDPEHEAR